MFPALQQSKILTENSLSEVRFYTLVGLSIKREIWSVCFHFRTKELNETSQIKSGKVTFRICWVFWLSFFFFFFFFFFFRVGGCFFSYRSLLEMQKLFSPLKPHLYADCQGGTSLRVPHKLVRLHGYNNLYCIYILYSNSAPFHTGPSYPL